ncbi:hypothetical protein OWV82_008034 [Melia azedarach]|uniref:Uncharacterized protein n=1 Tax=Melia azedarach TaxID=155640 RepID=A0ACC1YB20_MELAZ|nr:hypothetical protein OWV82_008034 [Melia azedarach]
MFMEICFSWLMALTTIFTRNVSSVTLLVFQSSQFARSVHQGEAQSQWILSSVQSNHILFKQKPGWKSSFEAILVRNSLTFRLLIVTPLVTLTNFAEVKP